MHHLCAFVFYLGFIHGVVASCPYSIYGSSYYIVADQYCITTPVCYIESPTCTAHYYKDAFETSYLGTPAIGNMTNYPFDSLTLSGAPSMSLSAMILPDKLDKLIFTNIKSLNLSSAKSTSWPQVAYLTVTFCTNIVATSATRWPPNLKTINSKSNGFIDVNLFPPSLTSINLQDSSIQSITNQDWRALTFLGLERNRLDAFANVNLSSKLKYFCILSTNLTNITIGETTALALNLLNPWDGTKTLIGFAVNSDVKTDPVKCAAIGGTIQQLFKGKTTYKVTACILGTLKTSGPTTLTPSNGTFSNNLSLTPTTVVNPKDSNSSNTSTIVGVVVGVTAVIVTVIAVCIFIRRKKRLSKRSTEEAPYQSCGDPYLQPSSSSLPQRSGHTLGTDSSHGSKGRLPRHPNSTPLDVSYLLDHRLVLTDLIVTSNKPLASAAYGEVWLGSYGPQQVAIKRLKSRQPQDVQKFIDEIILLSQLDSAFIVKFIGASWTKPIEIECVVEYMNLGDLRSYLVSHSPEQFPWDQKYHCIVGIVRGLVYLHTYNPPIIHRDLKSRNVLLDSAKGTKLTDFGTSRVVQEDDTMTNGIGTYQWMAPEVVNGSRYSCSADIYSFGVILSELCTHQVPYAGVRHRQSGQLLSQHQVLNEVREGRLQPSFEGENVPSLLRDIAMQCLQLNEHNRPNALELSAIFARIKSL